MVARRPGLALISLFQREAVFRTVSQPLDVFFVAKDDEGCGNCAEYPIGKCIAGEKGGGQSQE